MDAELLKRPRLFLTKLLRRYTLKHGSRGIRNYIRNSGRKWCVDDELKVPTSQGFWMRASPKDYATYGIYFFGNYDLSMTSVFSHLIKPGDTVWDIGTERGWFTLQMAMLVGANGRVDSFEAFPPTVEKLKANVDLNNFHHVHVNGVAVCDVNSKMWFVPPSNNVTNNISFLDHCNGIGYLTVSQESGAIEVNTINLNDYYESEKIQKVSLMKIDIEGAEVSALRGADKLIRKDKPVIAIEYNRQTALRGGSSVEELNELILSYNYKLFLFEKKFIPFDLSKHTSEDIVLNVYCFPN